MASLFSGGCNYFFQVVAARQLSAADFANFNGWFADLAVFFMFGGVLQYAANFRPAHSGAIRATLLTANIFIACATVYWFITPGILTLDRALIILCAATLMGWLMGQVQIRLQFTIISLINIIAAGGKLAMTALPYGLPNELYRYALAMFITYLPSLWLMTAYLWWAPETQATSSARWAAAVFLSIATAIMPQFDLALMHHTQSVAAFSDFARASLFYKAIYFLIFILAQWLLPRQLKEKSTPGLGGAPAVFAVGLILSFALAMLSPLISVWLLHWSEAPAPTLVFLSCLHTTLLALIFLRIQEACARDQLKTAGIMLMALGLEATTQWVLQLPVLAYLECIIGAQIALLLWTQHQRQAKN